jgi:1-acyl-sn-glycerol-3-phosphate acyltransferase
MWALWIILALAAVAGFAWLSNWLLNNPRGEVESGLLWRFSQVYARLVHRLRVAGREHLPREREPGPLILVVNHTAGVDPVLVQAACPFHIRWVMASDMRHPALEWMWRWNQVIFVDRENGDVSGAREAIRHVKAGGVLGIFPEGGIERPARTLRPFQAGVGFIIRRTGARVLPVVIEGTPETAQAFTSLVRTSRSTVTFHEPIEFGKSMSPEEIATELRRRFQEWTGWPMLDGGTEQEGGDAPGPSTGP